MNHITHINRSQNKISDSLAKFAHLKDRTITWIGSGPLAMTEQIFFFESFPHLFSFMLFAEIK